MKILITGACGFIGTNLIPNLLRAYPDAEILSIDNLSHGTLVESIHTNFRRVDIRDACLLDTVFEDFKPDYVFHFAGLVSIYDCDRDPVKAVSNNIVGSNNVFLACIKHGVWHVIFSETSAVYENSDLRPDGFDETQSNPRTVYATTKASVALLAESYHKTKGLSYTALRYFNVAGPRQDYTRTVPPLFAGIALRLLGGNNPIIFGDMTRRRDFVHVDDVNAMHLACLKQCPVGTFNVGTGYAYSLEQIAHNVHCYLKNLGKISEDHVLAFDFHKEINGEAHTIFANTNKADTELGWRAEKSIYDMIEDTVDFLLEEIEAGRIEPRKYMVDFNADLVKIGK
jgi:UDP-glucose 4-epimerase